MSDNNQNNQANERPNETRDYYAVQQQALHELLDLSAEAVAPAESEIELRRKQLNESARARLSETTAKIESRFKEESDILQKSRTEWLAGLESEYSAAREAAVAKSLKAQSQCAAEYEQIEKEVLRQKEDNLLMVETVAHATVKGLRKELKARQHKIAAQREQLGELQQQAHAVLEEYNLAEEPGFQHDQPEKSDDPLADFNKHYSLAMQHLHELNHIPPAKLFPGLAAYLLTAAWCIIAVAAAWFLSSRQGESSLPFFLTGPLALVIAYVLALLVALGFRRKPDTLVLDMYSRFHRSFTAAENALDRALERAERQFEEEHTKTNEQREHDLKLTTQNSDYQIKLAEQRLSETRNKTDRLKAERLSDYEQRRDQAFQQAEQEYEQRSREHQQRHDDDLAKAKADFEHRIAESRDEYELGRAALETRWREGLVAIKRLLDETDEWSRRPRLDWGHGAPHGWRPPSQFANLIPFGQWGIDLGGLAPSVRALAPYLDQRDPNLSIPAFLQPPNRCSLLLDTDREGRAEAVATLRAVMLRLLTSAPPGRVRFTIIDPVGLGENFAGFMHLVDYEEALVGGRIWTESEHIDARLTELTSHMENVIQKYLRNEFETIDAYNQQAGELAEPYRFLVIADFPANLSDTAVRRLNSIVNSGARCGVFTLIARDRRIPLPPEVQIEDIEASATHLVYDEGRFVMQDELRSRFPLSLDAPPDEDTLTKLMHVVGRGAKDSLRVETPFAAIAPDDEHCWSRDSRADLSVALGQTGAVRLQSLKLGRGIAQHALIAGKTGSGKSTLLHVLITNLALWYSPDEIEFYLVDFKKGVEFKTYVTHTLPHARAVAIESDREFGVSVLQRIDAEMARRGDLFRAAGVQDLAAYRDQSGERMPRTLLIVDEFQVFFTEDDKLAQDAAILLDRLVRQGRAFGIHVLLGSQTLGGASGLARSTMGQMAVRIALNCSEADSQMILDDANVAARLLTRPGEAIYNDAGGLVEGNSPFQTAWLPDEERIVELKRIRAMVERSGATLEPPIVFEGAAPADIRQNRRLAGLLATPEWASDTTSADAWLGEAIAIKDPTHVSLKRQSGSNLIVVGQRDDAASAMLAAAMVGLGAQYAPGRARFVVLDGRPPEERHVGGIPAAAKMLPHDVTFVEWHDVAGAIDELSREVQRRLDEDLHDEAAVFLIVHGLQRYRMLRSQEESFGFSMDEEEKPPAPDKQFGEILREGPPLGVHVLVWADTLAAVERTLDRRSLSEFDNRVLFQMSAADSSNLIDTPEANKLGLYRALLYSEEQGYIEKFRPYAAIDPEWLKLASEQLSRKS